jgi:hypothetical protein
MGAPEMHPSRPLGAEWGAAHLRAGGDRTFGRAARSAVAKLEGMARFHRAISPSVRQGGARALAPRLRQKQRTRRSL